MSQIVEELQIKMPALDELEKEFKAEEAREKKFREDVTAGIHRLETRMGVLQKAVVPPRARAAWTNLMYSIFRVFTFAFIAAFVPFVTGIGSGINNMDAVKAAAWAASIAGLAAVLKLVQASVTKDEEPFLDMGIFDGKKKS